MSLLAASVFAVTASAPAAFAADTDSPSRGHYLIFFTPESTDITPAARAIVEQAIEDAAGAARVTVKGYAAATEDEAPELAARRAAAVAEALVASGVPAGEVTARPAGVTAPPLPELGDEMGRRVEIVLEGRYPSYSALRGGDLAWAATVR